MAILSNGHIFSEVYGWLGAGEIQSVLQYSDEIALNDDLVQLNKYPHGEISTAIINIISKFPGTVQTSAIGTNRESLVDMDRRREHHKILLASNPFCTAMNRRICFVLCATVIVLFFSRTLNALMLRDTSSRKFVRI
ncbi:unnamed protein product [Litomosoides sigmodontis]|uniref:Uncharacterized protein n=1 Tax=Litomosoides sigmodontis TaxID=42156 RepID=A0A3P7JL08_LITSI|nr:unnamed protein product [Litomosoides sigmodontis]